MTETTNWWPLLAASVRLKTPAFEPASPDTFTDKLTADTHIALLEDINAPTHIWVAYAEQLDVGGAKLLAASRALPPEAAHTLFARRKVSVNMSLAYNPAVPISILDDLWALHMDKVVVALASNPTWTTHHVSPPARTSSGMHDMYLDVLGVLAESKTNVSAVELLGALCRNPATPPETLEYVIDVLQDHGLLNEDTYVPPVMAAAANVNTPPRTLSMLFNYGYDYTCIDNPACPTETVREAVGSAFVTMQALKHPNLPGEYFARVDGSSAAAKFGSVHNCALASNPSVGYERLCRFLASGDSHLVDAALRNPTWALETLTSATAGLTLSPSLKTAVTQRLRSLHHWPSIAQLPVTEVARILDDGYTSTGFPDCPALPVEALPTLTCLASTSTGTVGTLLDDTRILAP